MSGDLQAERGLACKRSLWGAEGDLVTVMWTLRGKVTAPATGSLSWEVGQGRAVVQSVLIRR